MKTPRPLALMLLLAAAPAGAQIMLGDTHWTSPSPPPQGNSHHGHHGFNVPIVFVEREYVPVVEREVIREVPVAAPPVAAPPPPPPPRKPYVIGRNYSSLPPGCMKMIEGGASYFYCGGEWYRQVGAQYKAVPRP